MEKVYIIKELTIMERCVQWMLVLILSNFLCTRGFRFVGSGVRCGPLLLTLHIHSSAAASTRGNLQSSN